MITRFDTIHERDGQQDRQTDGRTDTTQRHLLRLCIALRGKTNFIVIVIVIYLLMKVQQ